MVIHGTELHIFVPILVTLSFIQDHRGAKVKTSLPAISQSFQWVLIEFGRQLPLKLSDESLVHFVCTDQY